jgi:hypothetical protein
MASIGRFKSQWVVASFMMLMGCCVVHDAVGRAPAPRRRGAASGAMHKRTEPKPSLPIRVTPPHARSSPQTRPVANGRCPWRSTTDRPQAVLAPPARAGAPPKSCKQLPNPWRSASPVFFSEERGMPLDKMNHFVDSQKSPHSVLQGLGHKM